MRLINVIKVAFCGGFSIIALVSCADEQKVNMLDFKEGATTTQTIPVQVGYIQFHGYRTWYKIVGTDDSSGKHPLVCIHGGPGVPHDYLETLEKIAKTGRRVIFYDQLGCGHSDRPNDDMLWTVELFKDELTTLLKELKIEKYHILGQSWGGMLALEHTLDHPKGLQSITLASTTANISQWIAEAERLRSELPNTMQYAINKHEADGTTNHSEYKEIVQKYYNLHVCRLEPWPEELKQAFSPDKIGSSIYQKMWGPSEFTITGTLKYWDVRNKLSEIHIPTLITSGRYDESTPLINKTLHDGIAHSQWVLFKKSAHLAHIEEPELYIKVLSDFLNKVELRQEAQDVKIF